jgi:hypothetical protein
MILDNSMTMLVQIQPLRCGADSIFPTARKGSWNGSPESKAGRDGGNLATQRESLLARTYEERTAKTLQTIVTVLAAKRVDTLRVTKCARRTGAGEFSASPAALPLPVDCVPLTVRSMVIGNVLTAHTLSAMSRQPAAWVRATGLGQKRMPLCNEEDMPTDPRCFGG